MSALRPGSHSSDPRFREIPRERVSDRVASELLRLIADGRLTAGERLPGERQLAAMMGVSRVSIRAALQQLKEQGLLSAVQGGGTRLLAGAQNVEADPGRLRIDSEGLEDVLAIRSVLEVWAARRAAERATQQQVSEIEDAHRALAAPAGQDDRAQGELRFHQAIARASGSRFYLHLFNRVRDTLEATHDFQRSTLVRSQEEEQAVLRQHADIVAAIRERNPAAAAAAAQAHLDYMTARHRGSAMEPAAAGGTQAGAAAGLAATASRAAE